MLKREFRLPAQVGLRTPITFRTPLFVLKYSPNNLGISRFGFVIRKAVDKRAVVRNRCRRVLRSCIEKNINNILPGFDMLFLIEKGIIGKKQEEICLYLEKLLRERKLLK